MATVSYPGVYVEEVSSGVKPIAIASTSTAAFIGMAEKGPINEPTKIYNFTQFETTFGGYFTNSYLAHAVLHFFKCGGSQCYIVRVTGANTATASMDINDRHATPAVSLTISAASPGVWGNLINIVITDGTNNPDNEFNLEVYRDGETVPVEIFPNLSMIPGTGNFVETVVSSSNFIRVSINDGNTNVGQGTSTGSGAPSSLEGTGLSRLRININGDGYQEVNLLDGVGGTGQPADLSTAANIAQAIQIVVSDLEPQRASTGDAAFDDFTCTVSGGVLVLQSGVASRTSSVNVAPSTNTAENATGLLNLGALEGGIEISGSAITRPANSPASSFYFLGDNPVAGAVTSVVLGSDGDPIATDTPYSNAFTLLDPINDVSLLSVPGIGSPGLVSDGMAYCENRSLSDCFFIGDMAQDDDTVEEGTTFRTNISTKNSYGAVYIPWVKVADPTGASVEPILIPPSGFVAGLYAKTDAQRGVWKAPAGTAVSLAGSRGLAVNFTDVEQGNLNPINVNVIRQFAAAGIVLWGARTMTSDPEWGYIPVRRMGILLRVSIYNGIQWAVFEPNDEPLWASLRFNITNFMMTLYRRGAFQGSSPADAFFVKVDSETTTQADIDLGIVNVLVGFAPLKPAEFVVVKISQKAGQPS